MELKALGHDLHEALGGPNVDFICETLATLPEKHGDGELELEQEILASFFNRKRNISVATMQGGGRWKITMGGDTPIVHCTNIRDGIIEFLELLVAQKSLEKG